MPKNKTKASTTKPKKVTKPKKTTKSPKTNTKTLNKSKKCSAKKVTVAVMKIKNGERNVSTARAREIVGGEFPKVNGRKYKYPCPSNTVAWTVLVNKALDMKVADEAALTKGVDRPSCVLRRQYEYVLFHANPRSRWKRTERTKHRRLHGLDTGDSRVVHHNDQRHMSFAKSEVLTPCEHQKVHGKQCHPGGTAPRPSYSRILNCKICKNGKCKPCDLKGKPVKHKR